MRNERWIIAGIALVTAIAVAGVVGVLATGGDTDTALATLGFGATTVTALLALLKAQQTKTKQESLPEQVTQQVGERMEQMMNDKSIIADPSLPPSLGGDDK